VPIDPETLQVGVVGLGLMGSSIVACLLAAGHPVVAITPDATERKTARRRLLRHLKDIQEEGQLRGESAQISKRFTVSDDYHTLAGCEIVIETIIEDLAAKQAVIRSIEEHVAQRTLIGSNTSALPITQLQDGTKHPGRILGIHWALPAPFSQFMEIICGSKTRPAAAQRALALAHLWGKEPTLVRQDVRGFIANRIGYAMLREAFALVEAGIATPADVDRALRHTSGTWLPFAGPFRYMDMTGLAAYAAVMRDLLPDLSCDQKVPALLEELVESGARGITNGRGFYRYTPAQAKRWEAAFRDFGRDIIALSREYSEDAVAAGRLPKKRRIKS
jgi:3-hydroxybutyryl-CoA dehydrogenase